MCTYKELIVISINLIDLNLKNKKSSTKNNPIIEQ